MVLKGEDVRIETIVLNRVDNEGIDFFADYKRIYKDPGRVSNSKNPTEHPIETLPGGASSVWKNSCPSRYRRDGLEWHSDPSSEGRSRRWLQWRWSVHHYVSRYDTAPPSNIDHRTDLDIHCYKHTSGWFGGKRVHTETHSGWWKSGQEKEPKHLALDSFSRSLRSIQGDGFIVMKTGLEIVIWVLRDT